MRPIDIDPSLYAQQLEDKVAFTHELFKSYETPKLEVFESEPINYRMRAEFRVWHEGQDLYHMMFDQQSREKYRVDQFPPASELINALMQDLIELLKPNEILRRKLFQIDYLSSLNQQIVVSLLYHKPLNEQWQAEMQLALAQLRKTYQIDIIGRAKKQKIVLDKDYLIEDLPLDSGHFKFKQIENSFTQPNGKVNIKMIEWALDVTRHCKGDLLELYCGLGNFSLPLAKNFDKVLATEISKTSVAAAQYNIQQNQLENVTILRMSSEEFVQACKGERTFNRLQGLNLEEYNCQTILVDPPRSGLDRDTLEMVKNYQNIVYISCNPDTLKDNLAVLLLSHKISRFALFDQFPYTHHAECGMYLERI